jgi:hypothetical protein
MVARGFEKAKFFGDPRFEAVYEPIFGLMPVFQRNLRL